jgi:WD40 repeat protein
LMLCKLTRILFATVVTTSLHFHSIAQDRPLRVTLPAVNNHQALALTLKTTLVGHRSQVFEVEFSPNGELLATSGDKENVTRLWNTSTGQPVAAVDGTTPRFSPNGHVLMTINKKTVTLWDSKTGAPKFTLTGHKEYITATAFSADGSQIATGSDDGTVRLWDAATGRTSATLTVWRVKKIPRYRIISRALNIPVHVFVKFSPDQQTLLTNVYWEESAAKLWVAATGSLKAELGGHTRVGVNYQTETAGVKEASYSRDGKFIETQSYEMLRLWDTATGRPIDNFKIPFLVASFSPDSKWLGLVNVDNVGFLNLETLRVQPVLGGVDTGFLNQLAFSADSRTCVIGSGYKHYHATVIDVPTGRVRARIPLVAKWGFDIISDYQTDVDSLSFHPSNRFLMGANHGSVRMWDVSDGTLVWESTESRDPATFSSDGTLLATVGKDKKSVLLWRVESH